MSQMTTRTAAALLFGGTLGLATAADAGLTVTSAYFNLNAGGVYATNFDISAIAAPVVALSANSSLSFSGLNEFGFLVSAYSDGNETWSVYGATIGFTADTNMTVQLTGNVSSDAATVFLVDTNTNSAIFMRASGSGMWDSGEIQLVAGGNYLVGVNGPLTYANGGTETGNVLGFSIVPAPGAAALVGLAVLMSRRRRA